MNRAMLAISLIAMFLAGLSLGIMGGIFVTHHVPWGARDMWGGPRPGGRWGRPGGPPPMREAMPRLQKLLDLTPEQVKRIEPIVADSRRQFAAERESLRTRIDSQLTPEQRTRWQAFQREHPFPGAPRGGDDRDHRPPPDGGEPR